MASAILRVKILVFLLALAALPRAEAAGPGASAADFLRIPVGARETSLGGALTAASGDANSVFYNPAGLGLAGTRELTFTYNNYFSGISQQWLAACAPALGGAVGLGVNYLNVAPFDSYDAADNRTGSVGAYSLAAYLGYGGSLKTGLPAFPALRYGAAAKYISEDLDGNSASGYGLDAGLQLDTAVRGLRFGAAAENLAASRLEFIREGARPAVNVKAGAAYKVGSAAGPLAAQFSLDVNSHGDGQRYLSAGVENTLYGALSLRAGYQSYGDVSNGLSFGLGLFLPALGFDRNTRLDYSYASSYELGNVHKFGFAWVFGEPAAAEAVPEDARQVPAAEPDAAAEFKRQLDLLYKGGPEESRLAAEYLARRDDPRVLEFFTSLMYSGEQERKLAAVHGLELLKDAKSLSALEEGLRDQAPEVRSAAALALGARKDGAAVPALEEALRKEKVKAVRSDIISALWKLPAKKD